MASGKRLRRRLAPVWRMLSPSPLETTEDPVGKAGQDHCRILKRQSSLSMAGSVARRLSVVQKVGEFQDER